MVQNEVYTCRFPIITACGPQHPRYSGARLYPIRMGDTIISHYLRQKVTIDDLHKLKHGLFGILTFDIECPRGLSMWK